MDPLSCIQLSVLIVCALFLFYFLLIENSLFLTNPYKLQIKADEGSWSAKRVVKLLDKIERSYATIIIFKVALSITDFLMVFFLFQKGIPTLNFITVAFISLGINVLYTSIILLLAKGVGSSIPDTISLYTFVPLWLFTFICLPISLLYEGLTFLFKKRHKIVDDLDEDELQDAVEQVSDVGLIEEEQSKIVQSVLDFDDKNVKQILTPKEKIFALDINDLDHEKLKAIILKTSYSRIPVYEGEFDNFIGVLLVKTYFKEIYSNPDVDIRSLLQKPYFVSSRTMIDSLFDGFNKQQTHIALVRNNKKQVIGMVTMEDVLEELVSDIAEPKNKKGGRK